MTKAQLQAEVSALRAELAALKRETEGHRGERRALREQIVALRREADALGRFLEDTLPAQLPKMELPDIHELTGIYKKLL